MSSNARDGWAIRRAGSCNDDEIGKDTWAPWWACCPNTTQHVIDPENNTRCNTASAPFECPDQCADPDLILWSDSVGLFCCEPELKGFVNDKGWKGCVTKEELEKGRESMTVATYEGKKTVTSTSTVSSETSLVSQTSVTTTSLDSSSTSGPSSMAGSSESSESHGSSTNTGAIAGGVVGGVCGILIILGIIWFLRRRRLRTSSPDTQFAGSELPGSKGGELHHHLQGPQNFANPLNHELPENQAPKTAQQSPYELHS